MCELLNENTQLKSNNKQKNANMEELRKELERKEKYILQLELTLIHSNEHELVTSSQLNSGLDVQKEISMLSQYPRL
jgi:predicted enzyme involved in methoxymalonyl-ACP biosynthesis